MFLAETTDTNTRTTAVEMEGTKTDAVTARLRFNLICSVFASGAECLLTAIESERVFGLLVVCQANYFKTSTTSPLFPPFSRPLNTSKYRRTSPRSSKENGGTTRLSPTWNQQDTAVSFCIYSARNLNETPTPPLGGVSRDTIVRRVESVLPLAVCVCPLPQPRKETRFICFKQRQQQ